MVLLDDLLFIGPLLGHIDRHTYRPHHAAVEVIQRRFIGGEQLDAILGLDRLLGYAGLFPAHDLQLRLDAGRIVCFHIPDIGMSPSLHLFHGLIDSLTEAGVNLFVDTILIFIPDEVRDMVDRGIQKMSGLPELLADPIGLLPSEEMKTELSIGHWTGPDILDLFQVLCQRQTLLLIGQQDELSFLDLTECQYP